MNKLSLPIGILGGTFDPIHNGHIQVANIILQQLHFAAIHLIPCFQPPHRALPIATAAQRLTMLKLAVGNRHAPAAVGNRHACSEDACFKNVSALVVDDCEIQRQGISYAIDTLIDLRQRLPLTPLCFIIGMDAFAALNTWHKWQELIKYCHFVVVNRSSFNEQLNAVMSEFLQSAKTDNVQDLFTKLNGKIYFVSIKPINISATNIRQQIKQHQTPTGLSPAVYEYIKKEKLYLSSSPLHP
jgi:nicotinate-nucleotide adenylyltransferase